MIEFRFHGRGGQGVVLSCAILAEALLQEGKYVQYSPDFGTERRGAPVRAFLRCNDKEIYLRQQIYEPDYVVVLDRALRIQDVISGLKPGGCLIVNSPDKPLTFAGLGPFRVATLDATGIALSHKIGGEVAPIVNTAMLGAIARVVGLSLEPLTKVTQERIGGSQRNVSAVRDGYKKVIIGDK